LARYHGKGIFKALITGTNERGEIRVQFHVVTDGHDQFMAPIMALRETLNAYGHVHPQLFVTDQPSVDKEFFLKAFPSLQAKQDQLDRLVSAPPVPAAAPAEVNIDSFSMICSDFDGHFEKMAIDWCRHVDGKDIFPKLPVYLRTHFLIHISTISW
jgi:hypothetical protein